MIMLVGTVVALNITAAGTAAASTQPWTILTAPAFPGQFGGQAPNPNALSCPTVSFCMAVWADGSNWSNGPYSYETTWNGHVWSTPTKLTTHSFYAVGVSCLASNSCIAFGWDPTASLNNQLELTYRLSGNQWTQLPPVPLPPLGVSQSQVDTATCASTTFCMAVGEFFSSSSSDPNGAWQTFSATWNGSQWLSGLSTNLPELLQLSCPTSSFCAGTGPGGPATWTPTGGWVALGSGLNSYINISCTTPSFCMATGFSGAVEWNGTQWTPLTSAPGNGNTINSTLSCATQTSCVATETGNTNPNGGSTHDADYFTWDGSSWSTGSLINGVSQAPGFSLIGLMTLSCPTNQLCMVMGWSVSAATNTVSPLAELYSTYSGSPPIAGIYVALGDSYSSGEGISPYFEPSNKCHRSASAYPALVDIPGTQKTFVQVKAITGAGWGFLACSGATTKQVGKQVISKKDKKNTNFVALSSPNVTLVTITVGGDDVGWSKVLPFCYEKFTGCQNDRFPGGFATLKDYAAAQFSQLQRNLVPLIQEIRTEATNARILVLGYPLLLPSTTAEQDCWELHDTPPPFHKKHPGMDNDEQNWIRQAADDLNSTISTSVTSANRGAEFVPVAAAFAGHEVCGSGNGGQWINAPLFTIHGNHIAGGSFHPNVAGQAAYADVVNQYLATH